MGARRMRRKNSAKSPTRQRIGGVRTVRLAARVITLGPPPSPLSQEAFCEIFGITDQTARNWRAKGLPVEGTKARPQYPVPQAITWGTVYSVLSAVPQQPGPGQRRGKAVQHLTLADAEQWHLKQQLEDDERRRDSRHFVIVPLSWDHPARERMLAMAAAGVRPEPDDDEEEEEGEA